tara:strand:+ start:3253 stop:3660 length:408 start_codon:yes stop_codon:yes gene_type:complete
LEAQAAEAAEDRLVPVGRQSQQVVQPVRCLAAAARQKGEVQGHQPMVVVAHLPLVRRVPGARPLPVALTAKVAPTMGSSLAISEDDQVRAQQQILAAAWARWKAVGQACLLGQRQRQSSVIVEDLLRIRCSQSAH